MSQLFYVDKTTSTPADTFLAFGLAQLLTFLTREDETNALTIQDAGDCYRLELAQPLRSERLEQAGMEMLFKGLDTAKKKADLPQMLRVDYVQRQSDNQAYFEARKLEKDAGKLRELGVHPPPPEWPAWAVVNQMSAVDAYNGLAKLWYAHKKCFPELLQIVLTLYGERPNDLDAAEAAWKTLAKAQGIDGGAQAAQLQVVNPGMGKGGNRSKADGLAMLGLKGFWLPEYLKFAGLFQAGIPRMVKGSKDRKTYALRPKSLKWETHARVFPKFQEVFFGASAVQMDILAVLRYCEVFLQQWKDGQETGRGRFARGRPGDHVAALDVVFYKHLGSAAATMNMSTLVLPEWLPFVDTKEQAEQFLSLLTEHRDVVRGLDEKIGDEYELLRAYRDFLSARDLRAFYRFAHGYSKFVMRKMIVGRYPPRQFTIPNLEVLMMAHDKKLEPILKSAGFMRIAEAIRRSTVVPQYQKAQGRDSLYEIRYGLGDQLLRHAQYAAEFTQELSRFMHDYNRENARKSETRKQQFRANITTEDIREIVGLIDEYGAPTVANLLVAFGYARDPKLGADKGEPGADQPDEDQDDVEADDESEAE